MYVSWSAVCITAYRRRKTSSGEVAVRTGCGGASFMGFWLCGPLLCLPLVAVMLPDCGTVMLAEEGRSLVFLCTLCVVGVSIAIGFSFCELCFAGT